MITMNLGIKGIRLGLGLRFGRTVELPVGFACRSRIEGVPSRSANAVCIFLDFLDGFRLGRPSLRSFDP